MSYWEYPSQLSAWNQTYSILWNIINNKPAITETDYLEKIQIGMLLAIIGKNAGTSYGCKESSTSPTSLKNWLASIGYHVEEYQYNKTLCKSSLDNDCPVFIIGYNTQGDGHGWLIDGYGKSDAANTCGCETTIKSLTVALLMKKSTISTTIGGSLIIKCSPLIPGFPRDVLTAIITQYGQV